MRTQGTTIHTNLYHTHTGQPPKNDLSHTPNGQGSLYIPKGSQSTDQTPKKSSERKTRKGFGGVYIPPARKAQAQAQAHTTTSELKTTPTPFPVRDRRKALDSEGMFQTTYLKETQSLSWQKIEPILEKKQLSADDSALLEEAKQSLIRKLCQFKIFDLNEKTDAALRNYLRSNLKSYATAIESVSQKDRNQIRGLLSNLAKLYGKLGENNTRKVIFNDFCPVAHDKYGSRKTQVTHPPKEFKDNDSDTSTDSGLGSNSASSENESTPQKYIPGLVTESPNKRKKRKKGKKSLPAQDTNKMISGSSSEGNISDDDQKKVHQATHKAVTASESCGSDSYDTAPEGNNKTH